MRTAEKLKPSQHRVLQFLKTYREPCNPAVREIAEAVGLSHHYVRQIIGQLVKSGQIESVPTWGLWNPLDQEWQFTTSEDEAAQAAYIREFNYSRGSNLYRVLVLALLFFIGETTTTNALERSSIDHGSSSYATLRRRLRKLVACAESSFGWLIRMPLGFGV